MSKLTNIKELKKLSEEELRSLYGIFIDTANTFKRMKDETRYIDFMNAAKECKEVIDEANKTK